MNNPLSPPYFVSTELTVEVGEEVSVLSKNAAARVLTGASRDRTPVPKQLFWLPISFQAQFKLLVSATCLALEYLKDLLLPYGPVQLLRSSNRGFLKVLTEVEKGVCLGEGPSQWWHPSFRTPSIRRLIRYPHTLLLDST